jgi:hypothetical protein
MEMGKKIKLQLEEKNKYVGNSGLNGSGGSNCGGVDNQLDPYVRRSELKYELNELRTELKNDLKEELRGFVTKDELKEELNLLRKDMANFVTKADLKEALSNFVTKADLREELKNFVTKDELKYELNKLTLKMDNGFERMDVKFTGMFEELKTLIKKH